MNHQSSDVESKVALITGGGSGLGREIALKFLERGYNVVISYNSSEQGAKEILDWAKEHPNMKVFSKRAELTNEQDRRELLALALSKFGRVDVLVNNAALGGGQANIDEIGEKDWDAIMNLNVKAPFFLSRAAAKSMVDQGGGKIINILSVVGLRQFQTLKGGIHYAVSKAALAHLTKCMALFYAPKVQINAVVLGFMDRRMAVGRKKEGERSPEITRRLLELIPAGRFGHGNEVAELCLYLCSEDACYITGQTIGMDGGMSLV
jgi:3-oxoacyl-[acyl-carrier protein] reductase